MTRILKRRNDSVTDYIGSLFAAEDMALKNVKNSLHAGEAHMQISPYEGKILHLLVKMTAAQKIVEIGTLAGYSAIWMARALPSSGKLYCVESDNSKQERILKNFIDCGVADRTELVIGKALDVLPKIEKYGPFDIVFIDADKANYVNYLLWAEKNLKKHGLIIGDNSFLFGAVYGDNTRNMSEDTVKIMQQFNQILADSEKYTGVVIPTFEGLTVAIKNF